MRPVVRRNEPRAARSAVLVGTLVCVWSLAACGGGTDRSDDDGPGARFRLPAVPAPTDFVRTVDHPYFPLTPGSTWEYRARTADGTETIRVAVLPQTRVVDGITATVVRDQAFVDGVLTEDTYDWCGQDRDGNVWYLGEDTTAYEPGKEPAKTGSWEAGINGAAPGLVMPAHPRVGDRYQQEHLAGVAEDRGEILATDALEPDQVEDKYYARGVGTVLEEEGEDRLELIAFEPGGTP